MFIDIMFILSAVLTVGSAFLVATSKNLMHSCIFLLACLFGVAGLYATLGADFLAATQLVVYGGGIIVLILFAVMLTGGAQDFVNKFGIDKIPSMGSVKTYTIAGLVVVVVSYIIMKILAPVFKTYAPGELPAFSSTVEAIGVKLVTDHVLAFEISSILLLGALVGAAVISRPRRDK